MSSVLIATPTCVYADIDDRAEFDRLNSPVIDRGEQPTGHLLVKWVDAQNGIKVIFQHWIQKDHHRAA